MNAQVDAYSKITGTTASHNAYFRVQNTNSYPIIITGVGTRMSSWSVGTTKDFKFLYNPSAITYPGGGAVGSGVNGWLDAGSTSSVFIPSPVPSMSMSVMTGLMLIIPPGETYSFMLATTNNALAVASASSTAVDSVTDGVKVITGGNAGYVGLEDIFYTSGTPAYSYWGFAGYVTIVPILGEPCSGVPSGGTATISSSSGPGGTSITLNASELTYAMDMEYQWEESEDSVTWTDIPELQVSLWP